MVFLELFGAVFLQVVLGIVAVGIELQLPVYHMDHALVGGPFLGLPEMVNEEILQARLGRSRRIAGNDCS